MVEIPEGEFWMGSDKHDDEKPIHRVQLSSFQMMRAPVTQWLYREVVGENPSHFTEVHEGEDPDDRPVEQMSWFDAIDFCNALSERLKLTPCYIRDGESVKWIQSADGFRLPTEAEWEYACRAGTETHWWSGDEEEKLSEIAWYDQNSEGKSHSVGLKPHNPWGLFDMHGNVWEWNFDIYDQNAYKKRRTFHKKQGGSAICFSPINQENTNKNRVLRGGAWNLGVSYLRSAYRGGRRPEIRSRVLGFRCVRGPRRPR